MESRPWLAKGQARTAHARIRSRKAWTEIAAVLNKEKSGSLKSPDQWCKYWKDKKAALKRKVNLTATTRPRTDGDDEPDLSSSDQKILMLMGEKGFNSGDQSIPRDPLPKSVTADKIEQDFEVSGCTIRETEGRMHVEMLPKIEEDWDETHPATDTHDSPELDVDTDESVSSQADQSVTHPTNQLRNKETFESCHAIRNKFHKRRESQRKTEMTRGRLLRGSLFQRRSQLSLTERLIAVEEKRVQAELVTARAQETNARAQEVMAQAANKIADAFIGVAESIQNFVRHRISQD